MSVHDGEDITRSQPCLQGEVGPVLANETSLSVVGQGLHTITSVQSIYGHRYDSGVNPLQNRPYSKPFTSYFLKNVTVFEHQWSKKLTGLWQP